MKYIHSLHDNEGIIDLYSDKTTMECTFWYKMNGAKMSITSTAAVLFYESKIMFRNVMTICDNVEAEVNKRLKR